MTQEYPCGSFSVFMDFPSARKVLTCKEIKTSGRARNSRSWDNSHSIGERREVWWNKPRQFFSRATQVDIEVPCTHRFSINILRSLCDCPEREVKYFSHFTGFKSYKRFRMVLEFFLPYLNRTCCKLGFKRDKTGAHWAKFSFWFWHWNWWITFRVEWWRGSRH